jgi:hypothetical protein
MLLTRNTAFLEMNPIRQASAADAAPNGRRIVWTDDYSNLFKVLK